MESVFAKYVVISESVSKTLYKTKLFIKVDDYYFWMKNKITKLFVAFLFSMGLLGLKAQDNTLTASGNATGSEGTVSYSVGQIAYIYKTGTNGMISEGLQQPYEIIIPIGIEDDKGISLECILFPNPANWYVMLKIENHDIDNLSYQLYNMNGIQLQNMKIRSEETLIMMDGLEKATYFLIITKNGKPLKTFQVIKK